MWPQGPLHSLLSAGSERPAAEGESSKRQLETTPDSHLTSNHFRILPSSIELQRSYVCCDFRLRRKRDGGTDWTYRLLNSGVVLTRVVSVAGVTKRPFPRLSEPSGRGPVPLAWHCRAGRGHKATLLCTGEKRQHRHLWSNQRRARGATSRALQTCRGGQGWGSRPRGEGPGGGTGLRPGRCCPRDSRRHTEGSSAHALPDGRCPAAGQRPRLQDMRLQRAPRWVSGSQTVQAESLSSLWNVSVST